MTSKLSPDAPVFLIGFMASGKTTVGRLVAASRNWSFRDLDQVIIDTAGRSVAQIFADEGEAGFRRRESDALRTAAAWRRTVVATGGGAACAEANLALMLGQGRVVALSVTPEEVVRRAGGDSGRPLLQSPSSPSPSSSSSSLSPSPSPSLSPSLSPSPSLSASASPSPSTQRADLISKATALLAARAFFYARAHHRIDTVGKSPEVIAAEVLRLLDADPS